MKRGDYSSFSKSNIMGEKIFRQRNFDQKRMDQLTGSLIAMRKKEKLKDFLSDDASAVQKPSKQNEKESLAL